MISLDNEANPFRSFSQSLAMDNDTNDDDSSQQTPSWVNAPEADSEQSTTTSAQAAERQHQYQKSSLRSRWLILALTCIVMTGSYYAYDIPSALHQQLQDYMPQNTQYETKFNLLYTVYSIPNVVLPLFGGNVVDRYGAPRCLTLFATFVCMGAILLSLGVTNQSWNTMYVGRFLFGFGAESLCVAQSTIVSDWFEGKEVALAMGIGLSVSRLGSIWNNIVSPKVANRSSIVNAFWIGALLTFGSLLMAGIIVIVDKRAVHKLKRRRGNIETLQSLNLALLENEGGINNGLVAGIEATNGRSNPFDDDNGTSTKPCTAVVESEVHITDIRKFGPLFWLLTLSCFVVYGCVLPFNNVASGILLERNYFKTSPEKCHLEYPNQCSNGYLQNGTNYAFDSRDGDICTISPTQAPVLPTSVNHTSSDSERSSEWEESSYIYSPLSSQNVDCGDSFWLDACTSDYCTKQHDATEHAGRVMSIPYLISALSSPPLGHLVDKIGRRALLQLVSSSLLFLVHLTLATSASSPIGPMVGQGIAYSLYAAVLWPSVPITVPKQYIGTAFGVITSIHNIGLALFPLMIAGIYNASGGRYIPNVEFFFMGCAAAGIIVGIYMNRLDKKYGGKLNKASTDIEEEELLFGTRVTDFAGVDADEDEYFSPLLTS